MGAIRRQGGALVALGALAAATVGCGRIGYDPLDAQDEPLDGADASDDADDGATSSLIHEYLLNGTYDDELGGPPLVGRGGTFVAGGYQFGPNQGLDLTGAMPDQVYTVDVLFTFDAVDSWRKILDFKDLSSDNGWYVYETNLQFVVVAGSVFATGTGVLSAGTQLQASLTRDATGQVHGYVDRQPEFTFADTAAVAALTGPGAVAHFFVDDTVTGSSEAAGGVVRRIRIYDAALSADQILP